MESLKFGLVEAYPGGVLGVFLQFAKGFKKNSKKTSKFCWIIQKRNSKHPLEKFLVTPLWSTPMNIHLDLVKIID